jgi:hypothetical protein
MLLPAKLGLVLAVYVEAAATVTTINAICYPSMASFTFTRKATGHLYNMYTSTVTISLNATHNT